LFNSLSRCPVHKQLAVLLVVLFVLLPFGHVEGVTGGSRNFVRASADYIYVDHGGDWDSLFCSGSNYYELTFCFWMKADYTDIGDNNVDGFGTFSTTTNAGWILIIENKTGDEQALICLARGTGGDAAAETVNDVIVDDEWTHVCCRTDSANKKFDVFVNGTQPSLERDLAMGTCKSDLNNDIRMGLRTGGTQNMFDGQLAYPTVWTRELTDADIMAEDRCGPEAVLEGRLAYWPLTGPDLTALAGGKDFTNSGSDVDTSGPPLGNCNKGGD
jgi:hypothetical protein